MDTHSHWYVHTYTAACMKVISKTGKCWPWHAPGLKKPNNYIQNIYFVLMHTICTYVYCTCTQLKLLTINRNSSLLCTGMVRMIP